MKWTINKPEKGDMIRVKCSENFYHYGVFVSDNEIIQFGFAPNIAREVIADDIKVCVTDIHIFSSGAAVEVAAFDSVELSKRKSPDETVQYARSKIGTKGYSIIHNNCEHFANECVFGQKLSRQTDDIRNLIRSMPVLHLYISQLPSEDSFNKLYPPERDLEIVKTTHPLTKRQRYYVWKLLEYAFDRSFGIKINTLDMQKNENGKWICPSYKFSLSHSGNALAVVLSKKEVGVDIEKLLPPKSSKFAEKILSEAELQEYESVLPDEQTEYLIKKWTVKESVFKMLDEPVFSPSKVVYKENTFTDVINIDSEDYVISVASPDIDKLKIYNVDVSKLFR